MSFLKKLFKKEKKEVKEPAKKTKEKVVKAENTAGAETREVKKGTLVSGVIRAAHITEKTSGSGENKYAFLVNPEANKIEVKRAVGSKYGVEVSSVNIVNTPGKERRRGRQIGWKQGYKKAIITLRRGQTIEVQ